MKCFNVLFLCLYIGFQPEWLLQYTYINLYNILIGNYLLRALGSQFLNFRIIDIYSVKKELNYNISYFSYLIVILVIATQNIYWVHTNYIIRFFESKGTIVSIL